MVDDEQYRNHSLQRQINLLHEHALYVEARAKRQMEVDEEAEMEMKAQTEGETSVCKLHKEVLHATGDGCTHFEATKVQQEAMDRGLPRVKQLQFSKNISERYTPVIGCPKAWAKLLSDLPTATD